MATQRVSPRTLPEFRAALAAARSCSCRPCAIRAKHLEERIAVLLEAEEAKPKEEDLSQYDQTMLIAGFKVPKIKETRQMTRAQRIESGKRFSNLIRFRKTTEGIAREQGRFDRLHGIRGIVVRG